MNHPTVTESRDIRLELPAFSFTFNLTSIPTYAMPSSAPMNLAINATVIGWYEVIPLFTKLNVSLNPIDSECAEPPRSVLAPWLRFHCRALS
jgi:hypothetical protein